MLNITITQNLIDFYNNTVKVGQKTPIAIEDFIATLATNNLTSQVRQNALKIATKEINGATIGETVTIPVQ